MVSLGNDSLCYIHSAFCRMRFLKPILLVLLFCGSAFSSTARSVLRDDYSIFYAGKAILYARSPLAGPETGVQIGILNGNNISRVCNPRFIQWGIEFNWVTKDQELCKVTRTNVAIPICYVRKMEISKISSLNTLVGVNLRYNMTRRFEEANWKYSIASNYLQVGANIGASVTIDNLTFGFRYNPDFTQEAQYIFLTIGVNIRK